MSIFASAVVATVGKRSLFPCTGQVYIKQALCNVSLELPLTAKNAKGFQSMKSFNIAIFWN